VFAWQSFDRASAMPGLKVPAKVLGNAAFGVSRDILSDDDRVKEAR
jgi:hypothetical protein